MADYVLSQTQQTISQWEEQTGYKYHKDYLASAVAGVVSQCGSAGGAMFDPEVLNPIRVSVPPKPRCFMMYAPPVIIEDTYMSIMRGFQQVNIAFHATNGGRQAMPDPRSLTGPVLA